MAFMETFKPLWLPKLPPPPKVDAAIEAFAVKLQWALIDAGRLSQRDQKYIPRMGPRHVEPTIMETEAGESDLAAKVATDIVMNVRCKSREVVPYERPVEPEIVAQSLNDMSGKKLASHRYTLMTALTHSFLDDTEARMAFFRDPLHGGIFDEEDPRRDPETRERMIQEDLQQLFERVCRGELPV